jgi:hypothetical protein
MRHITQRINKEDREKTAISAEKVQGDIAFTFKYLHLPSP